MNWLFPSDERSRARRDRVLALAFAVSLVFLVVRAAWKTDGVLVRNQQFGARFLAGEDPYFDPVRGHRIHGPYPPTLVWVAVPLALLPTLAARIAWACVEALALVGSAFVLRRWTRTWLPSIAGHFSVLYAAALLLASRYILRDMAGGGANVVHGALALWALDASLRGRDVWAALPFAFSLACKPYLAPLLVYFAARGKGRTLLSTFVVGALLCLLPACVYGFDRWIDLSARWVRDVAAFARADDPSDAALALDGWTVESSNANQSLGAAVERALAAVGPSDAHRSVRNAALLTAGCLLLFVSVAAWATIRAPPGLGAASAAFAWLPLCLLASPVTWKAHHALLLPLFYVLACAALTSRRRRLAIGGLALYWLTCDLLSAEIVGRPGKLWLEQTSIVAWADIALLAGAIAVARAQHSTPDSPRSSRR